MPPLIVHGTAIQAQLWLRPTPQELLRRYLSSMEGSPVRAEFTKEGSAKSWSQVKMHFGLAVEMIRHAMYEQGWGIAGVSPTKDMVHKILSECCGGVGTFGEMVRLSEQDTKECSKFFENIRDWAAINLHIAIPDPDPNWRQKCLTIDSTPKT